MESFVRLTRRLNHSGIPSLWNGLSASILRQATYSTARFGLYNAFAEQWKRRSEGGKLSTSATIACAGLAGGLAGVIGNPAEVIMITSEHGHVIWTCKLRDIGRARSDVR